MNTLLRSLIVWLLLLAVPYQGVAAAAMGACAPQHGVPSHARAAPPQVQHKMQDAQRQEAQRPPCHETTSMANAADQKPAPAHADSGKCGSCSACGIGSAALPAGLPELALHAPASVAGPCAASELPSVHLDQPERPPRPRLA